MLSAPRKLAGLAAALLCAAAPSVAQRPNGTSPCDYYAEKTVGANTAANQLILMQLVLHSALLGPFSKYNTVKVPNFVGALQQTTYLGDAVDLAPYFTGALASTNRGGNAVSVNFLDDGGAEALKNFKAGNGNPSAEQE